MDNLAVMEQTNRKAQGVLGYEVQKRVDKRIQEQGNCVSTIAVQNGNDNYAL